MPGASVKAANKGRAARAAALRIALISPCGTAIIRLSYPEEALLWDSDQ